MSCNHLSCVKVRFQTWGVKSFHKYNEKSVLNVKIIVKKYDGFYDGIVMAFIHRRLSDPNLRYGGGEWKNSSRKSGRLTEKLLILMPKKLKPRVYMIKHIVTFKLSGTPEVRREVAEKFKAALLELPSQIEVLKSMEVGINENPAEDWDVVLIAEVPTMADVEIYAKHPAHVAAAGILSGHKELRACVDFPA